ncbi:thymidylate kinase [Desulfuromonas soudanensis]|uniref:Thymidylate kinase n=1 Tax=Desulfuromonas soudanensis TaxID=1603606 RepID=A0A0M4D6S8_9BACT|nr:dTMP kinase [Desulfuromonas soudanensis]ALC16710.1 thymidylate kinase [Desulfuromonas soudanensis]
MALFITFEGIEGSGKTTQIRLLAERLGKAGKAVVATREPGGCPIADMVRQILLSPGSAALVPRAELLLYAAARAQHVDEVIIPALKEGKIVLCDRFIDATLAYQGHGRRLDASLIDRLNQLATGGLSPDLTLLLDMPAEKGLRRARQRNEDQNLGNEDRFEQESLAFHSRVRQGYLFLAEGQDRFRRIDAEGSAEEVARRIAAVVDPFLEQHSS